MSRRRGAVRWGAAVVALAMAFVAFESCAPAGPRSKVASRTAPVPPLPPTEAPGAATIPASPAPQPLPAAPPVPAAPAPAPPEPRYPSWVRIGLATDLESVTLPCCDGDVAVDVGGTRLDLVAALRIAPAAASLGGITYRVQIAALKDEDQAKELARRLGGLSGWPADARFDAQAGIYRVRIGKFGERPAAEEAAKRLTRFGVDSSWIVSEGAHLGEAALELSHRGKTYRVAGRRFVVAAPADSGVRWEGRRYRGRLVVFLNDRGRLNLINELPIEQYLRGVVPRELGPGAYPELEALKAQAVAARSYTLRNLGEFADEGYDLCGTPRCQVYGGMEDEHPLSDRAVSQTAGEVLLYGGQPIDALYSATCGGHTENVERIFPLKRAAYLRGVPCIEGGQTRLENALSPGARLAPFLVGRALGSAAIRVEGAADLERALASLARAAGLATPEDHLASLDRREVQRFLGSMFDLAADARLFVRPEDLSYLVANPPPEWNAEDRLLAAFFVESGLLAPPAGRDAHLSTPEAEELLLQLALFLRVVERRDGGFSSLKPARPSAAAELVVRDEGKELHVVLPSPVATYRAEGGEVRPSDLLLEAGDPLRLYLIAGGVAAVIQEVDPRGASFDRTHQLSRWTRFRSDAELAASVASRLPGFEYRSFEVLERGISGRVSRIRLLSRGAETVDVEGLAVRWTLDLPDTLFTARRLAPEKGPAGWQFSGRGWGHGVGLCQVGSYGMARRGHDYRSILAHYYGGARLERVIYLDDQGPAPQSGAIAAPGAAR